MMHKKQQRKLFGSCDSFKLHPSALPTVSSTAWAYGQVQSRDDEEHSNNTMPAIVFSQGVLFIC